MKTHTMRATCKTAALLSHFERTQCESISAVQAADVMQCEERHVACICGHLVRNEFLKMEWRADGVHYLRPSSLVIEHCHPYLEICLFEPDQWEEDPAIELLQKRQTCVAAAGLPLPMTTGVRSVFEWRPCHG